MTMTEETGLVYNPFHGECMITYYFPLYSLKRVLQPTPIPRITRYTSFVLSSRFAESVAR